MTTRETVSSPVIELIVGAYAMADEDRREIEAQIVRQLTTVYRMTIQNQLNLYGCQRSVTGPDAKAQIWIAEKASADAESIVRTYNRELENRVQALYRENRRANRSFYASRLDQWAAQRSGYKTASISLNTMTAARAYAQDRFIRENGITGRFAMVGPPPVCKICIRIKAKGPLTWEECQKPENFLPAHVGCPHKRAALVIKPINCAEAWTG